MNMRILMVIAMLMLIGALAKSDVILAVLAVSSLCFAGSAALADRRQSLNPIRAEG